MRSLAESQYHGLVLQAQKRWSNGFLFNANYTLSKATDNGQNSTTFISGFASVYDPANLDLEEGYSNLDRRHRGVVSLHYAPDWLWGFQLGAIGTFESGLPLTANITGSVAAATGGTDTSTHQRVRRQPPRAVRGAEQRPPDRPQDHRRAAVQELQGRRRQAAAGCCGRSSTSATGPTTPSSRRPSTAWPRSTYDAATNRVTVNLTEDTGFLRPTQASSTLFGPRDMQIGLKFLW